MVLGNRRKQRSYLDDWRDADGHRGRQTLPDRAFQQRRYRAHCLLHHVGLLLLLVGWFAPVPPKAENDGEPKA